MTTLAYILCGLVTALLLPVVGAVLFYLGAWATLTERIWKLYSPRVAEFMECPACSGTWYCGIPGAIAWAAGVPFLVFPGLHGAPSAFSIPGLRWATPVLMALWGTYWVPFLAKRHIEALAAMPHPEHAPEEPTTTTAPPGGGDDGR